MLGFTLTVLRFVVLLNIKTQGLRYSRWNSLPCGLSTRCDLPVRVSWVVCCRYLSSKVSKEVGYLFSSFSPINFLPTRLQEGSNKRKKDKILHQRHPIASSRK
jgi:hypothetical protein